MDVYKFIEFLMRSNGEKWFAIGRNKTDVFERIYISGDNVIWDSNICSIDDFKECHKENEFRQISQM